jgi:hypothetical protein
MVKTFAAIAERIEDETVHFLTENYLRGVMPLSEMPSLRRGQRFFIEWSAKRLAPEKSLRERITL